MLFQQLVIISVEIRIRMLLLGPYCLMLANLSLELIGILICVNQCQYCHSALGQLYTR